ncbi:MAG: DUF2069 domain-containing protein [Proteobacteria bacterium]|nr:DUF2069 domain-containing protein [Pseudomonadota bacterium]
MNTRTNVLVGGLLASFALIALQILWHGWLLPPPAAQRWPTLALAVLPLVPGVWIARRNLRRGVLVGGIVCLFYFCHGVSAAYSDSSTRWLALAEIALALVVIAALGWDARHYKRPSIK